MNAKLKKLFQQKVNGKTIIVTGASSGIGLTVSKYLAQAGAHVLLLARTKDKLDEVKAEIEAEGGKGIGLSMRSQRYGIN